MTMRSLFLFLFCLVPGSVNADLVAYYNFDGVTVAERLQEKTGNEALNASEVGSNFFNTRVGFGNVLANGLNAPYLNVSSNNALNFGTSSFSTSIWVRRTSDATSAKGVFDRDGGSPLRGYQLLANNDNSLRLRIDGTGGSQLIDTTNQPLNLNQWTNYIFTVDRTTDTVKMYVDGVESTPLGGVSIAGIGNISSTQPLQISTLNGGQQPARGQLDDLGIFSHVLTPAEIAAINANGGTPLDQVFAPRAKGLVNYYPLDEVAGSVSGQDLHGSGSGSVGSNVSSVPGVIGSAAAFGASAANTDNLITASTDAAFDPGAAPFSFSFWLQRNQVANVSGIFDAANLDGYQALALDDGRLRLRLDNTGSTSFVLIDSNTAVLDDQFHQYVVTVNPDTDEAKWYLDGKLDSTTDVSVLNSMLTPNDYFRIGGINSGATTGLDGAIDDLAFFSTELTSADVALINGLGQLAGIGVDQLDEAQALVEAGQGTAEIGGLTFEFVNIGGTLGDFGGSIAGGTAFIITDSNGNGIRLATPVPEPSAILLWSLLLGSICLIRRRRPRP